MRINNSPYKNPYPVWVMACARILPSYLAFIVLFLACKDAFPNDNSFWGDIFVAMCLYTVSFGYLSILYYKSWFLGECVYTLLLAGSVWVAFQDLIFGSAYAVLLTLLLIPYYHWMALGYCFARRERKKLQSLIGREGTVIDYIAPFSIVEIDGEEFDATPQYNGHTVQGLPDGATIVVLKAWAASLDVEEKTLE